MNSKEDSKPTLNYGHPRPQAPYPPLLREVGCCSSAVGAILFGVVLPCGGFQYVVSHGNDPGGPLFWPLAVILGGIAGAVGVPLATLLVYWLAWRIAGQALILQIPVIHGSILPSARSRWTGCP